MRIVAALALCLVLAALGGILFVYAGIYNIAATEPHTPPVYWVLNTAMREAVERHARDIEVPPLSDPAMVQRGFRQFEAVCVSCHGAPGVPSAQMGKGTNPAPPELSKTVHKWRAAELFWIVKYGLKMTGMPAWGPTHRDDELWAITAFLLRLPDLAPGEYRGMTQASEETSDGRMVALAGPVQTSTTACARCHGIDGAGKGTGGFPRLSGQSAEYLYRSLEDYASGARPSGIMHPIAHDMTKDEMREVAAYYSAFEDAPYPPPPEVGGGVLQMGGALAAVGAPEQGVQACNHCHGALGVGRPPDYPYLAGQYADYLSLQLHLWKRGERAGGQLSEVMRQIAARLTDEQIEAVSLYFASVRPDKAVSGANFSTPPDPLRDALPVPESEAAPDR